MKHIYLKYGKGRRRFARNGHARHESEKEQPQISNKLNKVNQLENQIIFEDDYLLAINKPSGIAVHGGSGLSFGVIEALRALCLEARFLELVHCLDCDTSGILLIAKKRSVLRHLHEQQIGRAHV